MESLRLLVAGSLATLAFSAYAQTDVSGVIETYSEITSQHRGVYQYLTWGELDARVSPSLKIVGSYTLKGPTHTYDEAYVRFDPPGPASVRVGRIRTEFGFSDWSENYYNGFNHVPIVREIPLVGSLALNRDDWGAELTTSLGPIQFQVSAIDTVLTSDQLFPHHIDHTTVRAQGNIGPLIAGLDYLTSFDGKEQVSGIDARYTAPHLILRAEAFQGAGFWPSSGYYIDAQYRLPMITRTQLVARTEHVNVWGSDAPVVLHTVGVRQIFSPNLSVNVNYGWGSNLDYSGYAASLGVGGWTARAMFQIQF